VKPRSGSERGTSRRRGRPPGGDADETRRRLVDAAVACFAASGYAGASTRQIAAKAGVNVAALHYHFESKERLYEEALALVLGEEAPPAKDLAALVDALVAEGTERQARSRLSLFDLLSGPGVAPPDPRVAAVARSLPDGTSPAVAPLVVALVDAALLAARDLGAEGRGAVGHALIRDAVAAAAVALAVPRK